jgi:hypothetical protein
MACAFTAMGAWILGRLLRFQELVLTPPTGMNMEI